MPNPFIPTSPFALLVMTLTPPRVGQCSGCDAESPGTQPISPGTATTALALGGGQEDIMQIAHGLIATIHTQNRLAQEDRRAISMGA